MSGDEGGADDPDGDGDENVETDAGTDSDAPLGELAEELGGGADVEDDPFEAMDVDDVDESTVWETVLEDDDDADDGDAAARRGASPDAATEFGATADGVTEHVVDKREYCQRCPHFAEPPRTLCTNEGTRILEVVDTERFRVRNCPVASDGGLGPEDAGSARSRES